MLDAAQEQMPHGIEANRAQTQSVFDAGRHFFQSEGLCLPTFRTLGVSSWRKVSEALINHGDP